MVFITRLVIMLLHVLLLLVDPPALAVSLVLHAFIDRERWNPHPRQTEMIRPVEVSRLRPSERLHVVVIQIQRNLSRRNRRMLSQILRSQQSLLLGRNRRKQNRTVRFLRRSSKRPRQLNQNAAPGSVIISAIKDVVPWHIRAHAEM